MAGRGPQKQWFRLRACTTSYRRREREVGWIESFSVQRSAEIVPPKSFSLPLSPNVVDGARTPGFNRCYTYPHRHEFRGLVGGPFSASAAGSEIQGPSRGKCTMVAEQIAPEVRSRPRGGRCMEWDHRPMQDMPLPSEGRARRIRERQHGACGSIAFMMLFSTQYGTPNNSTLLWFSSCIAALGGVIQSPPRPTAFPK